MRLQLPVPVEKIQVNQFSTTFRTELREVDVIAVSRVSAGPNRWHYYAHYTHPDAHPEFPRIGLRNSLTAWIRRASHREFNPSGLEFMPGKANTVFIEEPQQ